MIAEKRKLFFSVLAPCSGQYGLDQCVGYFGSLMLIDSHVISSCSSAKT